MGSIEDSGIILIERLAKNDSTRMGLMLMLMWCVSISRWLKVRVVKMKARISLTAN